MYLGFLPRIHGLGLGFGVLGCTAWGCRDPMDLSIQL